MVDLRCPECLEKFYEMELELGWRPLERQMMFLWCQKKDASDVLGLSEISDRWSIGPKGTGISTNVCVLVDMQLSLYLILIFTNKILDRTQNYMS